MTLSMARRVLKAVSMSTASHATVRGPVRAMLGISAGQVGEVGAGHLDLETDGSLWNEAGQAWRATHCLGGTLLDGCAGLLRVYMDGGVRAQGALHLDTHQVRSEERPRLHDHCVVAAHHGDGHAVVPDEQWTMDFMHDTLATGQAIRVLTILDAYTRECLGLVAQTRFTGRDVARHLGRIAATRQTPATIGIDNGTEFTSRALDHWAYWNGVELDFSRPGRPGDNARIEAFNDRLRQECLAQHWFLSLTAQMAATPPKLRPR